MDKTYTFEETLRRLGNYVATHNPKLRHFTTERGTQVMFGKNHVSFISVERINATYLEEKD
jgi:hypothetical protein